MFSNRNFCILMGIMLMAKAIFCLGQIFIGWPVTVNGVLEPLWAEWLGVFTSALFGIWAFVVSDDVHECHHHEDDETKAIK